MVRRNERREKERESERKERGVGKMTKKLKDPPPDSVERQVWRHSENRVSVRLHQIHPVMYFFLGGVGKDATVVSAISDDDLWTALQERQKQRGDAFWEEDTDPLPFATDAGSDRVEELLDEVNAHKEKDRLFFILESRGYIDKARYRDLQSTFSSARAALGRATAVTKRAMLPPSPRASLPSLSMLSINGHPEIYSDKIRTSAEEWLAANPEHKTNQRKLWMLDNRLRVDFIEASPSASMKLYFSGIDSVDIPDTHKYAVVDEQGNLTLEFVPSETIKSAKPFRFMNAREESLAKLALGQRLTVKNKNFLKVKWASDAVQGLLHMIDVSL